MYPPVESIGLKLHVDIGNLVTHTKPGSAAFEAGIRKNDQLLKIDGHSIYSQADVTWALHNFPESGELLIDYARDGRSFQRKLALKKGWRESKLSWRASMKNENTPQRTGRKSSSNKP